MKLDHALCFAALAAFAGALHAEGCAGGLGRGMDITGNECNDPVPDMDAVVVLRAPINASVVMERARPVGGGAAAVAKAVVRSRGTPSAPAKMARVAEVVSVDGEHRLGPLLAETAR